MLTQDHPPDLHTIILFDGVCNLCNGLVQFLVRHDRNDRLRFVPLQAMEGLAENRLQRMSNETVVLIEGDSIYIESDAVLGIIRALGGWWRLLSFFSFIPKFMRDALYRLVARYRYKIFGKRDRCMIPEPAVREKFVLSETDRSLLHHHLQVHAVEGV